MRVTPFRPCDHEAVQIAARGCAVLHLGLRGSGKSEGEAA